MSSRSTRRYTRRRRAARSTRQSSWIDPRGDQRCPNPRTPSIPPPPPPPPKPSRNPHHLRNPSLRRRARTRSRDSPAPTPSRLAPRPRPAARRPRRYRARGRDRQTNSRIRAWRARPGTDYSAGDRVPLPPPVTRRFRADRRRRPRVPPLRARWRFGKRSAVDQRTRTTTTTSTRPSRTRAWANAGGWTPSERPRRRVRREGKGPSRVSAC